MEIKNLPFEVKADVDKRIITGYGSTYQRDLIGDQILQGAFKKTIAERFPLGKIKFLWQHTEPLGMPTRLEEDNKGLYIEAKISRTTLGNDALELIRDGVVREMSIGYDVLEDDLSEDGQTRYLKQLRLYEVSAVTFGMNPYTSIDSVKSLEHAANMFKEGRSLSRSSLERIRAAVEHLNELLISTENDDGSKNRPDKSTQKQFVPEEFTGAEQLTQLSNLAAEIKNYSLK